jgi:hypothetical protein
MHQAETTQDLSTDLGEFERIMRHPRSRAVYSLYIGVPFLWRPISLVTRKRYTRTFAAGVYVMAADVDNRTCLRRLTTYPFVNLRQMTFEHEEIRDGQQERVRIRLLTWSNQRKRTHNPTYSGDP